MIIEQPSPSVIPSGENLSQFIPHRQAETTPRLSSQQIQRLIKFGVNFLVHLFAALQVAGRFQLKADTSYCPNTQIIALLQFRNDVLFCWFCGSGKYWLFNDGSNTNRNLALLHFLNCCNIKNTLAGIINICKKISPHQLLK